MAAIRSLVLLTIVSLARSELATFTVSRRPQSVVQPTKSVLVTPESTSTTSTSTESPVTTTPLTTSTTTPSIQPTKPENVQIVGNYAVAVQHATTVSKSRNNSRDDQDAGGGSEENDEIVVVKPSSLLELLNFWRQLPKEKVAELYPQVVAAISNDPVQTSTESVLELLNKLREQQETSTTSEAPNSATSLSPIEPPIKAVATDLALEPEMPANETASVHFENDSDSDTNETEDAHLEETAEIMTEDETQETTTLPMFEEDSVLEQEPDSITQNSTTQSTTTTTTSTTSSTTTITPVSIEQSTVTSPSPTSVTTSMFTDYPPPGVVAAGGMPPATPPYDGGGGDESPNRSLIGDVRNSDHSFAIGVAVGILACLVVASTCVTWCVCRRHWGRRNVYATMEADFPTPFTKPGPPVIFPDEIAPVHVTVDPAQSSKDQNSSRGQDRVTEL